MADLSQTAANVKSGSDAAISLVQAGEAITAGMPVYQSSSDGKWYKADSNDAGKYAAKGIALCAGATDGYFVVQTAGTMNIGATTTKGEIYILSATAGAIAPVGDLTTGMYPVILCTATDTSGNVQLVLKYGSATRS